MKYVLILMVLPNFITLHSMTKSDTRANIILSEAGAPIARKFYCYTCQETFIRQSLNYKNRYVICHDCHKNFKNWYELAEHQLESLHIPTDIKHDPIHCQHTTSELSSCILNDPKQTQY